MTPGDAAAGRRRVVASIACAVVVAFALRAAVGVAVNVGSGVEIAKPYCGHAHPLSHRGFNFYGFMADHVLDGRGLNWTFYKGLGVKWANRAPLYPLFIAGVRWISGRASVVPEILAQSVLGALGCLVPALLAARWGGARAAVIAAWVAALWPYSIVQDTSLVEQVVYAPLVGLAAWSAMRAAGKTSKSAVVGAAVLAGALAGLAMMARLTFGATAAFLAASLLLGRPRLLRAAAFAAGFAIVLAPWAIRNHAVTGAWTLGTDGGRALWVGNAEATLGPKSRHPAESIDRAEDELLRVMSPADWARLVDARKDEVAQDREFRTQALRSIESRPTSAAFGGLRKAAALWSPVKNPGASSVFDIDGDGEFEQKELESLLLHLRPSLDDRANPGVLTAEEIQAAVKAERDADPPPKPDWRRAAALRLATAAGADEQVGLSSSKWQEFVRKISDVDARGAPNRIDPAKLVAAVPEARSKDGGRSAIETAVFGLGAILLLAGSFAAAARIPRMHADVPACLAVAGSFTVVAAVFWGESRYLAPLAGIGIAATAAWLARKLPTLRATTPLVLGAFLLLVGLTLAPGYVDNVDSRIIVRTSERLIDEGTWSLGDVQGTYMASPEYGARGDDGSYHMKFGPGNALIAAPFVVAGRAAFAGAGLTGERAGEVGASLAAALWFALAGVLVFRLARRFVDERGAVFAATAYSLASYAVVYGRSSYLETSLTVAVLAAFDAALRLRDDPEDQGAAAMLGAACVAAMWIKLASALALLGVAPILFSGDVRGRVRGLLTAGAVVVLGAEVLLCVNATRFGDPLATGYAASARFDHPFWSGVVDLVASRRGGLVLYCPLLLFAVPGTARIARKDGAFALGAWISFAASTALCAKFFSPFGGDAWGPRYLVPNAALLAVPAGVALAAWLASDSIRRAAASAAIAFALAVQIPPVLVSFRECHGMRDQVGAAAVEAVGAQRLTGRMLVQKIGGARDGYDLARLGLGEGRSSAGRADRGFDLWPERVVADRPSRRGVAWAMWWALFAASFVAGGLLVRRARPSKS